MPSATADTNIYVSALQFGGAPLRFLDLAAAGEFRLDISDAILHESLRVLRDKFHWTEADLREVELTIAACTERVIHTATLDIIQADPSDNRVLECAATAQSDCIVTGDKRHILPLGSYRGIPIIRVAEFLRQLEGQAIREP